MESIDVDEVGLNSASLNHQISPDPGPGQFTVFDLPRVMRDELDMRLIDLNTMSFESLDVESISKFGNAVAQAGCFVTNIKMNQSGLDMSHPNPATREQALKEYKQTIDIAVALGARWVRPLPLKELPNMDLLVTAYRELAEYGAARGIQIIVENFGWMVGDPDSVSNLIQQVDRNIAAQPDTGNWTDNIIRDEGLAKTFPLAVSCDYKAFEMSPSGDHEQYDLYRCYTIGREAGFRGPWCLEHLNPDSEAQFRELKMLRDMIRKWRKE